MDLLTEEEFRLPKVTAPTFVLTPITECNISGESPSCYDFDIKEEPTVYIVPISTLSLFSQEQVTTILNRWVIQSQNNQYPIIISKISSNMKCFISEVGYENEIVIMGINAMVTKPIEESFSERWSYYLKQQFSHNREISSEENQVVQIENGLSLINSLSICPICGQNSSTFQASSSGTFHCSCYRCDARWSKDSDKSMIILKNSPAETLKEYGRYLIY
jgi:hypothetical protein